MNRSELGNRVAERTGLGSSDAKGAVDAVFEVISDALANGEDVRIAGFGAFGTRRRTARRAQPPDGRDRVDRGLDGSDVQAGKAVEGRGEYGHAGLSDGFGTSSTPEAVPGIGRSIPGGNAPLTALGHCPPLSPKNAENRGMAADPPPAISSNRTRA